MKVVLVIDSGRTSYTKIIMELIKVLKIKQDLMLTKNILNDSLRGKQNYILKAISNNKNYYGYKGFAFLQYLLLITKGNVMKFKNKIAHEKYRKGKPFIKKRNNNFLTINRVVYYLKSFIINHKAKLDVLKKEPADLI